ncbi:MAG: hypothetical protein ABJ242_01275 [Marinomonas sp.]
MRKFQRSILAAGAISALAIMTMPAMAQTQNFDEIDALSDAALDEQAGIQTASNQAANGDYLEAIATLERVLAIFPKSIGARTLHAVYLCDIDDKQGGLVELRRLKKKDVGEEALRAAFLRCGSEMPS